MMRRILQIRRIPMMRRILKIRRIPMMRRILKISKDSKCKDSKDSKEPPKKEFEGFQGLQRFEGAEPPRYIIVFSFTEPILTLWLFRQKRRTSLRLRRALKSRGRASLHLGRASLHEHAPLAPRRGEPTRRHQGGRASPCRPNSDGIELAQFDAQQPPRLPSSFLLVGKGLVNPIALCCHEAEPIWAEVHH